MLLLVQVSHIFRSIAWHTFIMLTAQLYKKEKTSGLCTSFQVVFGKLKTGKFRFTFVNSRCEREDTVQHQLN